MFKTLASLALTASAHKYKNPLEVDPAAGSVGVVAHTSSINHIMGNAVVPITFAQIFYNKTFDLDVHESNWKYSFDLDSVHVESLMGPNLRKFEQNGNEMKVTLGEFDLNVTVDADFKALKFIPFETTAVDLKNITVEFTLEPTSDDNVHWALKDSSVATLGDFNIHMKNSVLNKLVSWNHWAIQKIINS